jgi:hypothetical protein
MTKASLPRSHSVTQDGGCALRSHWEVRLRDVSVVKCGGFSERAQLPGGPKRAIEC